MIEFRIKEILEEQGHSKYWLHKQLDGIGYQNLSKIMNNEVSSIKLSTLDKLCSVLDVSIKELFKDNKNVSE